MIIPVFSDASPVAPGSHKGLFRRFRRTGKRVGRHDRGWFRKSRESGLVCLVRCLFTGVVLEGNHADPAVVLVFRAPDLDLR